MSYKWHYFNATDDLCKFKHPFKLGHVELLTYCGREVKLVKRHTEFKDRVTCLKCLNKINKLSK